MATPVRARALLASFLAGVGGSGAQGVLLAQAGFVAGQATAAAFGPSAYVVGWSAGAYLAGRSTRRVDRALLFVSVIAPLSILGAAGALARLSSSGHGAAPALGFALLAAAGLAQGALLPLFLRACDQSGTTGDVAGLLAASFLGSLIGIYGIGFECVARFGRVPALSASAFASTLAALCTRQRSTSDVPPLSPAKTAIAPRAALIVACTTGWVLALEWLGARIAVLWVGSQAPQVAVVLAMGMGALALGAALVPRVLSASPYALLWTLAAASASTVWLAYCAPLLDLAQPLGDIAVAAALVIPALAPLGGVLPLVYRGAAGEGGRRLGSLLACEIPGAIVIAPAMHAFVLPSVGVSGVCAVCSGLGALCCASFAVQRGSRGAAVVATVVCAALAALAGVAPPAALRSPRWNDAALTVRAFQEDREFAVAVVDDGLQGERTLLTDQFRAAGTGRDYQYMRALGHLPVLLHRAPERVAVLALGTGTTLGSVSLHAEVAHIEVLEISAAVVRMAPWFAEVNRGALAGADTRVNVVIDDGRRTLARRAGRFDVITMEPLLPDSPFGVYLYTPEFYAVARAALAPRGILCQWVPPHALEPEVFDAVVAAFSRSFEHTQAWLFGTQLILVASEHAIELEPARWTSLEGVLAAELTQLGFDDYGGVRARFVGALSRRSVSRPLTDLDPWIAWRHKPADARSLSWLPRNLEQVASWSTPPPWPPLSDADEARRDAARTLREARIAAAWSEVELRAGRLDAPVAHDRALAALEPLAPAQRGEREVAAFVENIEYLARLRSGVARLAAGDARAALADLVRAAELRGERAEVHAYVAAALEVTGREPAARAAWSKARELCPGLERTPAGIRARALGARGASQDVEHAASVQR